MSDNIRLEDIAYPVVGYVDGEPYEIPNPKALREAFRTDFAEAISGGEPYYDAHGNRISPSFSHVTVMDGST